MVRLNALIKISLIKSCETASKVEWQHFLVAILIENRKGLPAADPELGRVCRSCTTQLLIQKWANYAF